MTLTNTINYVLVNFLLVLTHCEGLVQQCMYKKSSKPTDIRRRVTVSSQSLGNCALQCTRHADCCEYLWNTTSMTSQRCTLLLVWGTTMSVDKITVGAPVDEGIDQWSPLHTNENLKSTETSCHKTQCDSLTIEGEDSTYLFEVKRLNWNESLASCQRRSMELVSIETTVEFDELKKILVKFPETFSKGVDIWTSGSDRGEEGKWAWRKGNPNTEFTDIQSDYGWESGSKPANDTRNNCLALWSSMGYKWHDLPCNTKLMSICEGTGTSTTVPDTTEISTKTTDKPTLLDQLKRGGKLGESRVNT